MNRQTLARMNKRAAIPFAHEGTIVSPFRWLFAAKQTSLP
jgi:hypothetical protein